MKFFPSIVDWKVVPLGMLRDAGVPAGVFTVTSISANALVTDLGTYPSDLACDTTLFLICAVSKKISFIFTLALNEL